MNPKASKFGKHANLIIGGGPHIKICVLPSLDAEGKRSAIIMQNTAIGVTINTLVTLIQYYNIPLPMLISYRGEIGEKIACQVEMAVHTKALLAQMSIPTYHFHDQEDANELDDILKYCFMAKKPVAILTDASFWQGY